MSIYSFVFLDLLPNLSDICVTIIILRQVVLISNPEVLLQTLDILLSVMFIFADSFAICSEHRYVFAFEGTVGSDFSKFVFAHLLHRL